MDLKDTVNKEKVVAEAKETNEFRRIINTQLNEITSLKQQLQILNEKLVDKEGSTFEINPKDPIVSDIKNVENLVNKIVVYCLANDVKRPISIDNINLALGAITVLEKYRTAKINAHSVDKFKYPTGKQIANLLN